MVLYALLASLPMLSMDEAPGTTLEELVSTCELYLAPKQMEQFLALSLSGSDPTCFPAGSFAQKYTEWEIAFRNSIVKMRAARLNTDPSSFLNKDYTYDSEADLGVRDAFTAENPLEREKRLDRARWTKIDELAFGGIFNFNDLCAYKLKLEIVLKWKARSAEHSAENLDAAASEVRKEKETA